MDAVPVGVGHLLACCHWQFAGKRLGAYTVEGVYDAARLPARRGLDLEVNVHLAAQDIVEGLGDYFGEALLQPFPGEVAGYCDHHSPISKLGYRSSPEPGLVAGSRNLELQFS